MRLFELLLFIFISIQLLTLFIHNKKKLHIILGVSSTIILLIHLFIEGSRWQLYPVYTITILMLVLYIIFYKREQYIAKKFYLGTLVLIVLGSLLSGIIFPVFKIDDPSGPNSIGTRTYETIDESREAVYSNNKSSNRKIKYQIFYPAVIKEDDERSPWLQEGKAVAVGISKSMQFPNFMLNHTAMIDSNSYEGADIKKEVNYPVIVISHGWTGFRSLHTNIAEQLASHGYIVVTIDHTYGAAVTVFNDGTVAYLNPDALPNRDTTENFLDYANKLVNTYALDLQFVMDELEQLNSDETSFLYSKLDLNRLGLIGHSTGGGAVTKTALTDSRVSAIIGLDPWVEPIKSDVLLKGIEIPGLFLRSQQWEVHENNLHFKLLSETSGSNASIYQINGTNHTDFTMAPMFSPLTGLLGMAGDLDYEQSFTIQSDFILNFFDSTLKNQDGKTPEQIAKSYTEVVPVSFD